MTGYQRGIFNEISPLHNSSLKPLQQVFSGIDAAPIVRHLEQRRAGDEQFLSTCKAVTKCLNGDKDTVEHSIALLRECRGRMNRADVKRLAERLQVVQLRDKVRSA